MEGSLSSVFNGERAVVLLFVTRLLFSLPISLIYQGFALSLLAFAALFVDVSAENPASLLNYKTRPGVSSGILLGTVTLPAVMLSRLIQLSRSSVSSLDVEPPSDFQYLILQYWAVSASCFSALVFLLYSFRRSSNKTSTANLNTAVFISYVAFYLAIYSFSLATKTPDLHVTIRLFWVLCHGMASVLLIQHILSTFPFCVSVGEAVLTAGGLILYFGDMLAYTFVKIHGTFMLSKLGMERSEISTIIQGTVVGLLLFPTFYKFILRICGYLSNLANAESFASEGNTFDRIRRSVVFYGSLAVISTMIVPAWMQYVQNFHTHPFIWVFDFMFSEPLKTLPLCIYWISIICASVLRFYSISKHSKIERILLRKYYHLVAVLMFSPALILQPKFLDLAFGAALAVFLVLEVIRVWKIWPLGKHIHHFMNAFTDHRDSDLLIISHFSLLLGCALPKWMSSGFNDRPFAPFAGILSLGIGDTMASMVGHKYGVLRWSKTGKKTIEGTAAGITSVLVACSVLLPLLASTGYVLSQHWLSLLFAVITSGLLEAYTAQLDNAFIPLVFYSLLCL